MDIKKISNNTVQQIIDTFTKQLMNGALKPGDVIDSITLEKPLEAGTYQAMAVTTVYDDKGEAQLTSRVPVTLNVAG